MPHPLGWVNKNDTFLSDDPPASCGLSLDIRSNVIYKDTRQIVCEYDFSNLKEPGIPTIRKSKKFAYFFLIFLIILNLLVFITSNELTLNLIVLPIFTILIFGHLKWLFSRLIYKININDIELSINLEKRLIKIGWCDIEYIYVGRRWGGTKLKIKTSNPDINLPRGSFHLWVGSGSDEGERLLARGINKIRTFTDLKINKNMTNIIDFWNKFDV